ncbi:hypothetical protein TNCV_4026651 [Trichonephila clavipes]|nr:hypothetical protein TNCV_4026651 [Trichonephila clavipes]
MMDQISICEALAKWNEIDPFLKRIMTGDEKWVTYYKNVGQRSWSKCSEAAQTVVKPGLTTTVFYCVFGGIEKESFIRNCFRMAKH